MAYNKELFSDSKSKTSFELVRPDFVKETDSEYDCIKCPKKIPEGSPAWSMPGKESKQKNGRVVTTYLQRNHFHYPDCKNPQVAKSKPKSKEEQISLFDR